MFAKLIAASMTLSLIGIIAIMQLTTPATIHPIGLLVFFLCVYVLIFSLLGVLIRSMSIGYAALAGQIRSTKQAPLTLRQSYSYASAAAFAPVILLAMRTVGDIQLTDIVFVIIFVSVAIFYVAKRS